MVWRVPPVSRCLGYLKTGPIWRYENEKDQGLDLSLVSALAVFLHLNSKTFFKKNTLW